MKWCNPRINNQRPQVPIDHTTQFPCKKQHKMQKKRVTCCHQLLTPVLLCSRTKENVSPAPWKTLPSPLPCLKATSLLGSYPVTHVISMAAELRQDTTSKKRKEMGNATFHPHPLREFSFSPYLSIVAHKSVRCRGMSRDAYGIPWSAHLRQTSHHWSATYFHSWECYLYSFQFSLFFVFLVLSSNGRFVRGDIFSYFHENYRLHQE